MRFRVSIGLAVLQEMPDYDDELARQRGYGDVVAPFAPDAPVGGCERGGAPGEDLSSLDRQCPRATGSGFGNAPVMAASGGLTHPRNKSEIGGQLLRRFEASDVADGRDETDGDGGSYPWDRHQEPCREFEGGVRQQLLIGGLDPVVEVLRKLRFMEVSTCLDWQNA